MTCPIPTGLLRQYIAALSACLGVMSTSACFGWMNPIFNHLLGPDSEIPMTPEQAPWVVSIIEIGSLLSTFPAGILVNRVGRKPIIMSTGPVCIVSWLLVLYFPSVYVFAVARLLQGVGIGLVCTSVPVYLGEIADKGSRGAITSIFYNCFWLGYLFSFCMGAALPFYSYTLVTLALNIPFILVFFWQPESPHYLMMVGQPEKARKSLRFFRDSSSEDLSKELNEIKENLSTAVKTASVRDVIATPEDRRALTVLLVVTSVAIISGFGGIEGYSSLIFSMSPDPPLSPAALTAVLGVVMLLGGCVSSFTSDTLGRRPLLMISSVGAVLCHTITATYYFLLLKTSVDVSRFGWVAPVFILIYSGICTAGMYPVFSAYISELFETQTRGIASSLSNLAVTVCSYFALLTFQAITYNCGLYTNFFLYAITSLAGAIYFFHFAPETKGKSLDEIRKHIVTGHKPMPA